MNLHNKVYDLIGVGIGPFNLSLAALVDQTELDALFFEQEASFNWHPGMLIEGTDLQSPFLADFVSFADPTSPYTFTNYLHKHERLYKFYFFNRSTIPRREYNQYGKWVAKQLSSCLFHRKVINVVDLGEKEPLYQVHVRHVSSEETEVFLTKNVVIGTGSIPNIPKSFTQLPEQDIVHTSRYLKQKSHLLHSKSITIVGSGQSAAEVFLDLLNEQKDYSYSLSWYTRETGFFQQEAAKLGREVFSPEYVDYFQNLTYKQSVNALGHLDHVRNGIDPETLVSIYNLLYHRSIDQELNVMIQPLTDVQDITASAEEKNYELECKQWQLEEAFTHTTEKVVLATGYKPYYPEWLSRFKDDLTYEEEAPERFKVAEDYRLVFKQKRDHHIYTQVDTEHTHGTAATNLVLSVLGNQKIINSIARKQIYPIPKRSIFQQFKPISTS
ncbi:lysine N(6)-hydroxylase/L-ornithine N(5)-oxygenase family protein [Bacillus horti]|uniref:L-lysine N6-monooxygenase MbtG n=1 Tax=Caldalkalibacillus horti TaxID=77523 RepID=A0ABT9W4K5_9BACI|nr:SidA/IucD/PvdA family monooxygenase [Bacillus horti]MDQ0168166.1 lysine N6-hydroxylase [Bacillus horti]